MYFPFCSYFSDLHKIDARRRVILQASEQERERGRRACRGVPLLTSDPRKERERGRAKNRKTKGDRRDRGRPRAVAKDDVTEIRETNEHRKTDTWLK